MQGVKVTLVVKVMISNSEKGRVWKEDSRKEPAVSRKHFCMQQVLLCLYLCYNL